MILRKLVCTDRLSHGTRMTKTCVSSMSELGFSWCQLGEPRMNSEQLSQRSDGDWGFFYRWIKMFTVPRCLDLFPRNGMKWWIIANHPNMTFFPCSRCNYQLIIAWFLHHGTSHVFQPSTPSHLGLVVSATLSEGAVIQRRALRLWSKGWPASYQSFILGGGGSFFWCGEFTLW